MQTYFRKARERCQEIYSRYYQDGNYKHHNARYREIIMQHLEPDTCLLDAGCGAEMGFIRELSPNIRMSIGVDLGKVESITAPSSYAIRGDLHHIPFKDCSFDIIISMSVIEHLSDPEKVFREFSRVLKPKGIVVVQTPNKYDYVSLVARFTPFWLHKWILSRFLDRKEEDIFLTFYRANTRKRISSYLKCNDLIPYDVLLFNQYPAYLMFSPLLFRLGIVYERLTSQYDALAQLRGWILAAAEKRG